MSVRKEELACPRGQNLTQYADQGQRSAATPQYSMLTETMAFDNTPDYKFVPIQVRYECGWLGVVARRQIGAVASLRGSRRDKA